MTVLNEEDVLSSSNTACVNPYSIDARKSVDLAQALATHQWELVHYQSEENSGIIARFRCSYCSIEWTSVIVEPRESDVHTTKTSSNR